jgi:ferredoxin
MIASPYFTLNRPALRWAVGETGISSQEYPKSTVPRFDGSGLETFPITDSSHGNPQMLAHAIMNEDPYPIKALIANRFEPLQSIPDSAAVRRALEEGVQVHFLTIPIKIGGKNGRVSYVECLRAELGRPDASGRRRPIPIPESKYRIEADAVVTAIGQKPDFCPFPEPPVQTTPWCTIVTEQGSTRTSVKDIFAGGDGVTGPATVVEAIAAGKQAAVEINHHISGAPAPAQAVSFQKRRKVAFQVTPSPEKIANQRNPVPMLDLKLRKTTFIPVELGYSDAQAQKEAQRCLRCDVCIRCGACERSCHQMRVHALKFSQITTRERVLTDYPLASEKCIACGACALACPTQAIDYLEGPDYREGREEAKKPRTNLGKRYQISMRLGFSPTAAPLKVQTTERMKAARPMRTFWDIFTVTPTFMARSLMRAPAATTEPEVSRVPPSQAPATASGMPTALLMMGI